MIEELIHTGHNLYPIILHLIDINWHFMSRQFRNTSLVIKRGHASVLMSRAHRSMFSPIYRSSMLSPLAMGLAISAAHNSLIDVLTFLSQIWISSGESGHQSSRTDCPLSP